MRKITEKQANAMATAAWMINNTQQSAHMKWFKDQERKIFFDYVREQVMENIPDGIMKDEPTIVEDNVPNIGPAKVMVIPIGAGNICVVMHHLFEAYLKKEVTMDDVVQGIVQSVIQTANQAITHN